MNNWVADLEAWLGIPGLLIVGAIPLVFVALFALIAVYLERKISAFMQDRLGPMEVGTWGLLQTLADILKLIQKEDIMPKAADKFVFIIGPAIIFISAFAAFAVLPFSPAFIGADLNLGVFYAISITSLEVIGILACGWGGNNKWALYGAMRGAAQIISYEIPAGLAILVGCMMAGSLSMQEIVRQQGGDAGILNFFIFQSPFAWMAAVIYFIAALAETNRAPFDLPESESELVAGFFTEYGGMKFAIIFLAEYGNMFMVSAILSVLFLGGWQSPLPNVGGVMLHEWTSGNIWGIFWIVTKAVSLVFVQMWLRWTLPRLRVDQLMYLCWKILTPFAFVALLGTAFWEIYARTPGNFLPVVVCWIIGGGSTLYFFYWMFLTTSKVAPVSVARA